MNLHLHGLYAITLAEVADPSVLSGQIAAALAGGASLVQFRHKGGDWQQRLDLAGLALAVCRAVGVPFIINDDVMLAAALGADGVHLGRDDGDPRVARQRLGPQAIIGVSCYDDLALARAAEAAGADYVAFGSFFPSSTKPHAVRAEPRLLTRARQRLRIPLVAIGGITPQNGGSLIAAGAQMLAVVTGVFAQPDIAAAARTYSNLFLKETC